MSSLPIVSLFLLFLISAAVPQSTSSSAEVFHRSFSRGVAGKKASGGATSDISPGSSNTWTRQIIISAKHANVNVLSRKESNENSARQEQSDCNGQPGLSGSKCTSSDECLGNRTCQENVLDDTRCAFEDASFVRCGSGIPCLTKGEICLRNDVLGLVICLSEDFAREKEVLPPINPSECRINPTPVPTVPTDMLTDANKGSDPCISVDSLQHLSRQELVFEKDLLSNVLCDKNNSCATAGHMVTYRGNSMMMRSYCEAIGGCIKRVMFVNSPRYRMKQEIPSKSEDLVFTALSARYTTRAEEHLLSAIIRMGF